MRIIGKVGGAGRSFASDRRGNFAIATAAVSAVLLLAIGYGVNTAQLYHVKTNLRSAMDAAVTSTARDLTTGRISEKDAPGIVDAFLQAIEPGVILETVRTGASGIGRGERILRI